ncbi:MAG: hypothetical protein ABIZ80_03550 [Bryobacteraceae bacterium]
MKEFLKSFSSLSLALALLPIKQMENSLARGESGDAPRPAVKAMDAITKTILDQFGGTLQATFSALDKVQRGVIALAAPLMIWPDPGNGNTHRAGPRGTETSPFPYGPAEESETQASSVREASESRSHGSEVRHIRPIEGRESPRVASRRR